MSKQQKIILTTIVLFLLGGLGLAVYLARQIAKPAPRAEENRVVFTLQTSNPDPETNDEMTVSLFVKAPVNTALRTISAYIKYDHNLLEVVQGNPQGAPPEADNDGVYRSEAKPFSDWSYIKTKNNIAASRIEVLASYKPLDAVGPDDPKLLNADDGAPLLATARFRWKGGPEDATTLQLVTAPATSGAKDPAGADVAVAPASITIPVPAQTVSPSPNKNPVSWNTDRVSLAADDFYLMAGKEKYLADNQLTRLISDPGDDAYTTLEVEWRENDREMRLYMYFRSDGEKWWSDEIRTYNGQSQGDWIYYKGRFFETELGTAFTGDIDLTSDSENNIPGSIHFANLRLQAFLGQTIEPPTPTPTIPTNRASLYLSPPRGRVSAGDMFTSTIYLNTGGNDVSGIDAVLTYNPQDLNVVSTGKGDIPEFIAYFENIDNNAGKVTVSAIISPDTTRIKTAAGERENQTPVNGQGLKFATVTFKTFPINTTAASATSSAPEPARAIKTPINFDFTPGEKNDSNIAEYNQGGDILWATYGANYTIEFSPRTGTSLKLKLELCDEPSQRQVVIKLPDGDEFATVLSGENNGFIHTTNPVDIPAGVPSLNVRVAGYLPHTFDILGEPEPIDSADIAPRAVIDLTDFTLLGGDLDGSGKVNVLDFNLFKSDYLKGEETAADLDCSDQVNSLDYDGVIRNWNKESN